MNKEAAKSDLNPEYTTKTLSLGSYIKLAFTFIHMLQDNYASKATQINPFHILSCPKWLLQNFANTTSPTHIVV